MSARDAVTGQADVPTWEDATPIDVLYLLRNEADRQMKRLQEQVEAMTATLAYAQVMISRLDKLADDTEAAAELLAASDLFPTYTADVPDRSGLTRKESSDDRH